MLVHTVRGSRWFQQSSTWTNTKLIQLWEEKIKQHQTLLFCSMRVIDVWIYVISHVCLAGQAASLLWSVHPSICCMAKTFGQELQNFYQILSVLPCLWAPFTSAILYCFHWPWSRLGFTRSAQSRMCWLHFFKDFSTERDEIRYGYGAVKPEHLRLLLSQTYWIKSNNYCFTDCTKTHSCCHASEHIWTNLVQTLCGNGYCTSYILILILIQVHRDAKKSIISQSCEGIWMEIDMLLRLVDLKNFLLILSYAINIQGRETNRCDFV